MRHAEGCFFLGANNLKNSSDSVYYVVDLQNDRAAGFFALLRQVASACYVARKLGLVPHINIEGSIYNDKDGHNGIKNLFEYFYEQPSGLKIENIKENENFFIFDYNHLKLTDNSFLKRDVKIVAGYDINDLYLSAMGKVVKDYFVFKQEFWDQINQDIQALFCDKKVIGIHIRGTDYNLGLQEHPRILKPEQYYPFIDEALDKGFQAIFVATDEESNVRNLKNRFGNKILYYKNTFRSSNGVAIHKQEIKRDSNGFVMGKEVMRDMLSLAKCSGMIAGLSQVSIFARIQKKAWNEEFEYIHIIDNGIVGQNRRNER